MPLLKTGLRYFWRRPLQSVLCVLGVALGVAVVIAIDLANGSASRAFSLSTETVAGRATHQIVGGATGLDEDVYRRIKVELGVDQAAPVVSAYATALELDRQPLRVLGVDVFAERPFRSYLAGDAAPVAVDFGDFLTDPYALLLGQATAERYGLRVDDRLTLRVGDLDRVMRVAGLLQPGDENSRRALDNLALMDIGAAQSLFRMQRSAGSPGRISHVDLIADERAPEGRAVLERVASVLPPGARIVKPQARSQSVESLTDAFELNLTALSLLALVVGMFLIYNTITFSVVQRRATFGILRCLGVTRREIFRMVLVESLALSAIGAVLGVALGVALGRGAVGLVTQTINDLYYVVTVRDVALDPWSLVKGALMGVGVALLAALLPAYEATSVPPIGALRRSYVEQRVRKLLPWVALAGAAMIAAGAAALLLTRALAVNLGGIFGVVVGVAIASPLVTVALMAALAPALGAVAGVIGRMSARSVTNAISRTGIAIASLMIAVSVIIGLQSMIGSFRLTVQSWLDTSLTADVYVSPPSNPGNQNEGTLDSAVVDRFARAPGVQDVTRFRRVTAEFAMGQGDWQPAALLAVGSERERPASTFVWSEGDSGALWAAMRGRDVVQVSEPFANRHGITPQNNLLRLRTERGEKTYRVAGVHYDYSSDQGIIVMRRDAYTQDFMDDKLTSFALYLEPQAQRDVREFVARLRTQFAGSNLVISPNRDLRDSALVVFDRTFAITGALNLLATVVAFIGVLSALMALQIERTRELGMLRANGMTLRQMWRMTLLETGLMGGTAGLLAMPTGLALAIILVYIINLRSFGWTIRLALDPATFAQAMAIALVSALLAAVYPMLRLAGLRIANAVRAE